MRKKSKIIVECGSTKADWAVIEGDAIVFQASNVGFNPSYHELSPQNFIPKEILCRSYDLIYYYGAGTSHYQAHSRIASALSSIKYGDIKINSDMLAAARALVGRGKGYVSILGTGTNSCFYNGEKTDYTIPSLGCILGDFGSANHIGKKLLQDYFYHKMPEEIAIRFEQKFKITKEKIITELYSQPQAAKYLGSYAIFLSEVNDDWKRDFISEIFLEFVSLYLKSQKHHGDYPCYFTGSIAFYLQEYLIDVLKAQGYAVGDIEQSPSQKLIQYHTTYE